MFWYHTFTCSCPLFPAPVIEVAFFSPLYILDFLVINLLNGFILWALSCSFYLCISVCASTNSLLGCFSLFQGFLISRIFLLVLLLETNPSVFLFHKLSVSMNLGGIVPCPLSWRCILCEFFPLQVLLPSGFGGRTGPELNVGHIFPYWELTAITLVWGRADNWVVRARVRARCEPGLSLMISGWSHPISGEVGPQGSRAETLMVRLKLVPFLPSVCSPGSQYQNLCHTERIVLEQLGIVHVPSVGQSVCWDGPSTLFIPICYFCASNSYPCPH